MNRDLLELLACPSCTGDLRLEATDATGVGVESGALECTGCAGRYEILGGVPRFAPILAGAADSTSEHFAVEFTANAQDDRDIDAPMLDFIFHTRTALDPEALGHADPHDWYPTRPPAGYSPDWGAVTGKTVLEGGCGPGRFLPSLAEHAQRVVALELGSHVDRAAERCRGLPNVDLVQGSVLAPPFKPGTFDLVYSLGVLHHTEQPGDGARALGSLVAEAGQLSLWVYGPDYWGRGIRRHTGRAVHSYLRRKDPESAYRACRRWIYPLGRVQARAARRRWTKIACAPIFILGVPRHQVPEVMMATIFDYFAAPIISTHTNAEVCGWLEGQGFSELTSLPVPTSVRATRPA